VADAVRSAAFRAAVMVVPVRVIRASHLVGRLVVANLQPEGFEQVAGQLLGELVDLNPGHG